MFGRKVLGGIRLLSPEDSHSTTSGAMVVAGGVGVSKQLRADTLSATRGLLDVTRSAYGFHAGSAACATSLGHAGLYCISGS